MDDALLVCGLEGLRDLPGDLQRLFNRDRSRLQPVGQRLALDQLHDEQVATVGFFESVQRGNVRVIERRQDFCFPLEPRGAIRIERERVGKDLHRHVATKLHVVGAIHLAHAPRSEGPDDFIDAEPGAGGKGHGQGEIVD